MILQSFLKKQWQLCIVILLAGAFFVFASIMNFSSQDKEFVKWLSPDETANYTVAKLYAETGSLMFLEKYNLLAKDLIHPRSFRSDWGWIKPVSFIGLPLFYGKAAAVLGIGVLPYLTPLIAAAGLIFFYLLIKEFFSKNNALISTILAATFPVYIYFSSRSMFHNILFTVGLIIGLYFSVRMARHAGKAEGGYFRREGAGMLFGFLGGWFIGLGLTARTSELLWVGPLLLGLYVLNFRKVGVVKLFFLLLGMFTAVLPVIYWNEVLYGSWRAMGYPELNNSLHTLGQSGTELAGTAASGAWYEIRPLLAKIKMTIFHFGYKPDQSAKMFDAYVLKMFAWLFWIGSAGILLFIARVKRYTRAVWVYLLAYLCLSAILILYYGSWIFYDNPDPNSFTIGNSYTRYWLPVYLGALPFVSGALIWLTSFLRQRWAIATAQGILVAIIGFISLTFVWSDPAEGLGVSIKKQREAKVEWQEVLSLTESNAVIITRYHDKLLFPERKVIMGLFNDKNMITEYARLTRYLPVYYYNFTFPDKDVEHLNNGPLNDAGIRIEPVRQVTPAFTLYRLIRTEE